MDALKYIEDLKSHDSLKRESTYSNLLENLKNNVYSIAEKQKLLELLSSNSFLFHKIDESENDEAVGRSFALISIAAIVDDSCDIDVKWLMPVFKDYITREKDYRGKAKHLGWIHAIAHFADLVSSLSFNKTISIEDKKNVLHQLLDKVNSIEDYPLLYGEDSRISKAIYYMIEDNPSINKDYIFKQLKLGYYKDVPLNFNMCSVVKSLYIDFYEANNDKLIVELKQMLK